MSLTWCYSSNQCAVTVVTCFGSHFPQWFYPCMTHFTILVIAVTDVFLYSLFSFSNMTELHALIRYRTVPNVCAYRMLLQLQSWTIVCAVTYSVHYYTWCDNLIPGMALWKQNLLTCALVAAVAFKILLLWSYALREMMVPLPETVLKIVLWNTSQ